MADPAHHAMIPAAADSQRCRLLMVDLQAKLLPVVRFPEQVLRTAAFLLDAAEVFHVPLVCSEQYPEGLGPTHADLAAHAMFAAATRFEKTRFSAAEEYQRLFPTGSDRSDAADQVILFGIETHICVQQTALELLSCGRRVHVVADGCSSGPHHDHETALTRMRDAGITVTTAEAVVFEWCRVAGTQEFRAVSRLVRALRSDRKNSET